MEVVKQRTQNNPKLFVSSEIRNVLRTEGISGFYRGFFSTVIRELPFSCIQFPLWETSKYICSQYNNSRPLTNTQHALCGAFAGGLSGALTTPLDVAKTQIMLATKDHKLARGNVVFALGHIYRERGLPGLFSGVFPRSLMLMLGGGIFLSFYDI
ncbi:hypothetical protein Ciccas_004318, partial [Cichlidogyrus casuarinus]